MILVELGNQISQKPFLGRATSLLAKDREQDIQSVTQISSPHVAQKVAKMQFVAPNQIGWKQRHTIIMRSDVHPS
jgi:hypothetical protein